MIRRLWTRYVVCRRYGHAWAHPYIRGIRTGLPIRLRPTCLRCDALKPNTTNPRGYPDQ